MAEDYGVLKIHQSMEKSYITSVIKDTSSLGKSTLRAPILVIMILSLLNAKVSTPTNPCVGLSTQQFIVHTDERQAEVYKT